MTRTEALEFLNKAALKRHAAVAVRAGPSHGDPGGFPLYDRARTCLYWKLKDWTIVPGDEKDCNCGAREFNNRVGEAIKTLQM